MPLAVSEKDMIGAGGSARVLEVGGRRQPGARVTGVEVGGRSAKKSLVRLSQHKRTKDTSSGSGSDPLDKVAYDNTQQRLRQHNVGSPMYL